MAKENRRITLSSEELICAFESYRRVAYGFLPEGTIARCIPSSLGTITVVLETSYGRFTQQTEFTFGGPDILQLMLRFCIENHIMLPRNGRKHLAISDSAVTICIELEIEIEDSIYFESSNANPNAMPSPANRGRESSAA